MKEIENRYIHDLSAIGLTATEASVFLFLLEHGQATAREISRNTSILTTNIYHVLTNLKERGLISEATSGSVKQFYAHEPSAILRSINRKQDAAKRLLPDLQALYSSHKHKPTIRFYEGLNGIKRLYDETLHAQELLTIGSIQSLETVDATFFRSYQTRVQQRGIVVRDILPHTSSASATRVKEVLKGLYDTKLLPRDTEPFHTDILLWDDTIALISLSDPLFGTTITHSDIAKTLRIVLSIVWERL